MKNISKTVSNIIVLFVIVTSLLVIGSALQIFGHRTYIVKSGSMEPVIHTGSVVLVQKNTEYAVGDIITFVALGDKNTTTHRIVEIKTDSENKVFYVVKGDANNINDTDLVFSGNIVGKVSASIPFLGYFFAFIKTLPGLILFILIPVGIIIGYEIKNIHSEVRKIKAAKRQIEAEVINLEEEFEKDAKKLETLIEKEVKSVETEVKKDEEKLVKMFKQPKPRKGAKL